MILYFWLVEFFVTISTTVISINADDELNTFITNEHRIVRDIIDPALVNSYLTPLQTKNKTRKMIQVKLQEMKVLYYDAETQTMQVRLYLKMEWLNERLIWNKTNYSNINEINVPASKVWTPNLLSYNLQDVWDHKEYRVIVYSDGKVAFIPMITLIMKCNGFNLTKFPHDQLVCQTSIGSLGSGGHYVRVSTDFNVSDDTPEEQWYNLNPIRFDTDYGRYDNVIYFNYGTITGKKQQLTDFSHTGEWNMTEAYTILSNSKYGKDFSFSKINLFMKFQRSGWHQQLLLRLPVIFNFVCVFLLLLPIHVFATIRLAMLLLNMLAFVSLLQAQLSKDFIPNNKFAIPNIVRSYIGSLIINMFVIIWTIIEVNCYTHNRNIKISFTCIRRFFLTLIGKVMLLPDVPNVERARQIVIRQDLEKSPTISTSSDSKLSERQIIMMSVDRFIFLIMAIFAIIVSLAFSGTI